jgi:hypothetical protein
MMPLFIPEPEPDESFDTLFESVSEEEVRALMHRHKIPEESAWDLVVVSITLDMAFKKSSKLFEIEH